MENFEARGNDSDLNTTYTKSPEGSPHPKSDLNGNRESTKTKRKNRAGFIKDLECVNDSSSCSDRDQDVSIYVPATQQVVHFGSTTLNMIPESDAETEYDQYDSDAYNNSTDFQPKEGHKLKHDSTFTLESDPGVIDQNSTFNIEPPTAEEISKFISDPEFRPSPTVKKVKIKLTDTFGESVVINDTIDDYDSDETQIIIPATQAFNWKDRGVESGDESKILESETEINSTFDLNETYNLPTPKRDLNGTNIVQNNMTTLESCSISVIVPADSQPSRSQQVKEKSGPSPHESNKNAFKFNESINPDPVGFITTRENEVISPIQPLSPDQKDQDELKKVSPAGGKKILGNLVPAPSFKLPKTDEIDDYTTDEDVENVKNNSRNKYIFSTRSRKYKEELAILKDIKNPKPSTSLALRRENSRIRKLAQIEEKRKKRAESAPFVHSRAPLTRNRNIVEPLAKDKLNRASKRTDKDHVMQTDHKRAKKPHFLAISTATSSSDSENDENDKVRSRRKVVSKNIPAKNNNNRYGKKANKVIENGNDNVDTEKDIQAAAPTTKAETKDDLKQEIEKMKVNNDYEKDTLDLKGEDSGRVNIVQENTNYTRKGNKRGAPVEECQNKVIVQSIKLKKTNDDNNNNNNKNGQKEQDNVKSDADEPVATISSVKPPAKKSKKATTPTTTAPNKNSKKAITKTSNIVKPKPETRTIAQFELEEEPLVTVPEVVAQPSPRRLRNHPKSKRNAKPEVIVIETKPKGKSSKTKLKTSLKAAQVEKKASPKKGPPKTTKKNPTKVVQVDPEPVNVNEGLRRSGRNRKPIDDFGINFMKFGVGKVK